MKPSDIKNILVIGRGFAGLTAALELARAGVSVSLLGPSEDPWMGSKAAQGASTIKGLLESSQDLFSLKMLAHRSFLSWLKELDQKTRLPTRKIVGVYEPFWKQAQFSQQQSRIFKQRFCGAFALETNARWPVASSTVPWAVNYYPQDFWVDPDQLLVHLQHACQESGVENTSQQRVIALSEYHDGVVATLDDGTAVHAKKAVVAVGAGITQIKGLGQAAKMFSGASGHTFRGKCNQSEIARWCLVKELHALARFEDEWLLGSSTDEKNISLTSQQSHSFTPPTYEQSQIVLASLGVECLPESAARKTMCHPVARWGIRVRKKNRSPYVGPCPGFDGGNVFLNTAYYKSGVTMTHLGAQYLAHLILGTDCSKNLRSLLHLE